MSIIDKSLGEIATLYPASTRIFRKYKLDFCCGGANSLRNSVDGIFLRVETIEQEIMETVSKAEAKAWTDSSTPELIHFIIHHHHALHRLEFPELIQLARKVEEVHGDHALSPCGLTKLLSEMFREMQDHMKEEEEIVFPALSSGQAISAEMDKLLDDHQNLGQVLRDLETLCHGFNPPAEACTTWRLLYQGCARLVHQTMEHVHLENNVLFPRFYAASVTI